MAEQLRPQETVRDVLTLAGAPTSADALRTHLRERFGMEIGLAELRAMAKVEDEMLIPPAERPRGKKERSREARRHR